MVRPLMAAVIVGVLTGCGNAEVSGEQERSQRPPNRAASPNAKADSTVGDAQPVFTDQFQLYKLTKNNPAGTTFLFRVTGDKEWYVLGTKTYAPHSILTSTVVHAGILKSGESGLVRVTLVPGPETFEGSTQNGIKSSSHRGLSMGYVVEKYDPNLPPARRKTESREPAATNTSSGYSLVLNLNSRHIYGLEQRDYGIHTMNTGEQLVFNNNLVTDHFRTVGNRGGLIGLEVVRERVKIYRQQSPDVNVPFLHFDTDKPDTLQDATAQMYAAGIKQPYRLYLTPQANIVEFEGLREIVEKMYATGKRPNRTEVETMMIDIVQDYDHHLGFYPSKTVAIGESWDGSWSKNGGIKTTMTFTLKSATDQVAVIEGTGWFPTPSSGKVEVKGSFQIDRRSGWLIKGEETYSLIQTFEGNQTMTTAMTKTLIGTVQDANSAYQKYAPKVADDPGSLSNFARFPREVFYFRVTGKTSGSLWGSDIYTADSQVGKAAVHAGVLNPEETGIVRVVVKPGQERYESTTRNGVSSRTYGPWKLSYSLNQAEENPLGLNLAGNTQEGKKPAIKPPQWLQPQFPEYDTNTINKIQPSVSIKPDDYDLLTFTADSQNLIAFRDRRASRGSDYEIWEWDLETGRSRNRYRGNVGGGLPKVETLARTGDGKTWISGNWPMGAITVWDAASFRPIKAALGHQKVEWMSLSPDGKWLTSVGRQGNILLWDLSQESLRPRLLRNQIYHGAYQGLQTLNGGKGVLYFNSDSKVNAVVQIPGDGGEDQLIWKNNQKPSLTHSLTGLSPDGKYFFVDGFLVDVSTKSLVGQLPFEPDLGHRDIASWTPDGRRLAVSLATKGDSDQLDILIWNVADGRQDCLLVNGESFQPTQLEFSPDGNKMMAATRDYRQFKVWELPATGNPRKTRTSLNSDTTQPIALNPRLSFKTTMPPTRVHFVDHDRRIAGYHQTFDLLTGLESRLGTLGHRFVFLSQDQAAGVVVYNSGPYGLVRQKNQGFDFEKFPRKSGVDSVGHVYKAAASIDGRYVAACCGDTGRRSFDVVGSSIQLWRINGTDRINLGVLPRKLNAVAFGEKNRLITGGDQGYVAIWDAESKRELVRLPGLSGRVVSVAGSTDGKFFAATSEEGVSLWTASRERNGHMTHQPISRFAAKSITFSPTGKWLFVIPNEGNPELIEAATGKVPYRFHVGETASLCGAFDSQEKQVAIGTESRESQRLIQVFDLPKLDTTN